MQHSKITIQEAQAIKRKKQKVPLFNLFYIDEVGGVAQW